jgi:hypothetical protein
MFFSCSPLPVVYTSLQKILLNKNLIALAAGLESSIFRLGASGGDNQVEQPYPRQSVNLKLKVKSLKLIQGGQKACLKKY